MSDDREVKKDFDNVVNPETAQNIRAREMEEELRKNRKRKMMIAEGECVCVCVGGECVFV